MAVRAVLIERLIGLVMCVAGFATLLGAFGGGPGAFLVGMLLLIAGAYELISPITAKKVDPYP